MATDETTGDDARPGAAAPHAETMAKLEREWQQVMEIARTGEEDERIRAFSSFARKRRVLGIPAFPAPSEIIIREGRDSDHGRLWPLD